MSDVFMRRNINGMTPLDIKNMNDNFRYMWLKVFGNINTGDLMDESVTGSKIKKNTITAEHIDTSTLVVGENIQMGENASITWEQVSDRPTIPDDPSDIGAVADDMTAVFNALTNGGLVRGLYMADGQLYINADYIQSGLISAAYIKTSELVVGDNITMGANAVIEWAKVNNKPDVATQEQLTQQLANYVTNTALDTTLDYYATVDALSNYITSGELSNALNNYITGSSLTTMLGYDFLVTGKILANQITAGQINGVTIRTSDTVNYSVLENQYYDVYYGNQKKIHLGYDYFVNSFVSTLELEGCLIQGRPTSLTFGITNSSRGLTLNSDSAHIFSGDLRVIGDLEILGNVTFPATAVTVIAKFA